MKINRILCLVFSFVFATALLAGCTGDVPEPYTKDEVLAEAVIHTKIVVQEESETSGEEPTETVLLEKDITVSSTTKPALSLKDLVNTLDEENHISAMLVYNRITAFATYEANDTHMWFWSVNGNPDQPIAVAIADGDSVVFTYAEKSAELSTDEAGNVLSMTVNLSITAGADTIYNGEVVTEGTTSVSVKEILKTLREEGAFTATIAGSVKQINDYASGDGYTWRIYVDDEVVKPSEKVRDGANIRVVYEATDAA